MNIVKRREYSSEAASLPEAILHRGLSAFSVIGSSPIPAAKPF
jgi:hypothetical protein